ncbi:MAG: hypothetical protein KF841_06015 [Phycisphaerae bacterium]|nr:hypothetical protein [Phycisphaerae bacterium]
MPKIHRRVILTPPDLTDAVRADLERSLRAALDFQNNIAASSHHGLRLFSTLRQDDRGYYFDHEPAAPIDLKFFFRRDADELALDELLAAAFALAESLRIAHGSGGTGAVHGGLCPGVLLRSKDGIWKVADFRIAPILCDSLGVDRFLNLAVGPAKSSEPDVILTGRWEVLDESEYERDDRICAFVDPEKYAAALEQGERAIATFEAGSDIIAAGNLIALLAQRIHPFLSELDDGHRILDVSRMMASTVPLGIQRADLSNATDADLRRFAERLTRMLERKPINRPRAAELAESLAPLYAAKQDVGAIASARDAAHAEYWLAGIEPLVASRNWLELEEALSDRPTLNAWPAAISKRIDEIESQLREFGEKEKREAQRAADQKVAEAWFEKISAVVQTNRWEDGRSLIQSKPKLTYWPDEVARAAAPLEKTLTRELKTIDDHAAARAWTSEVAQLAEQGDWLGADERMGQKPTLEFWPKDSQKQIAALQAELDKHLSAIRAEHQRARKWIDEAKLALESKEYARAIEILHERPKLSNWPTGLLQESDRLLDQCAESIGNDAALKLQLRTENIERAARAFVRESVEAAFKDLIEPDILHVSVDGDQMELDESMDRGKAVIVVAFPKSAGQRDGEELRVPFGYDLSDKNRTIRDPNGAVNKAVTEGLGAALLKHQAAGPTDVAQRLKKGLFPEAAISVELKKIARQATASLRIAPQDKNPIALKLAWDAHRLTWYAADTADLGMALSGRAIEAASKAVQSNWVQDAPAFAPYAPLLSVEIDAPSLATNPLSPTANFTAKLAVNHPTDGRLFPIHEVNGEISSSGRVDVFGQWSKVHHAFDEIIVGEQNASRDKAIESHTAQASKDGAKPKITFSPKRIKSPTPEVGLEIRTKGQPDQELVGRWNPATFAYDFAPGRPSEVPTPPAPSAGKKDAKAIGGAETAKPEAEARAGKSRRKAMIGIGAAAAVGLIAVVSMMMRGTPNTSPPRTEPNSNSNTQAVDRPSPPAMTVSPAGILTEADPEFAAVVTTVLNRINNQAISDSPAAFESDWVESPNGEMTNSLRIAIGNSSIRVQCAIRYDESGKSWGPPTWKLLAPLPRAEIGGWLRGLTMRRIQAIDKEGDRSGAEALLKDLSPQFETLAAKGYAEVLAPLEEVVTRQVSRDPPQPNSEYSITEVMGTEHAPLAQLIQSVVGSGRRNELMVRPEFGPDPWDLSSADESTRMAKIPLGNLPPLQVRCTFRYTEASASHEATPTWTLLSSSEEQLALANALVAEGDTRVRRLSSAGKLNLARAALEPLTAAMEQLRAGAEFRDMNPLTIRVPGTWETVKPPNFEEVAEAGIDQQSAYPNEVESNGRRMLLVTLPPDDPLWTRVGVEAGTADWLIMYVDAVEWNDAGAAPAAGKPFNSFADAESAASNAGVAIPTLQQWKLGALKLQTNPHCVGLYDGLYEWTRDFAPRAEGDLDSIDPRWVTGGCSLNAKYNLPPAPTGTDLEARLDWLRSPLVTQGRTFGDDLVGLRTVKVLYPGS